MATIGNDRMTDNSHQQADDQTPEEPSAPNLDEIIDRGALGPEPSESYLERRERDVRTELIIAAFAMAAQIIPPQVTASGVGVYNGAGNLIGACSPLLMGWIIGTAGNFDAGLLVLVGAGVLGSLAMLPLIKRY